MKAEECDDRCKDLAIVRQGYLCRRFNRYLYFKENEHGKGVRVFKCDNCPGLVFVDASKVGC